MIVLWIVALILVIPIISEVGNSTSLQQGSATGSQLESVKAADIIASQFSKSVANSTLLIVVSADNVSSLATQRLVSDLVSSIRTNRTISGLNQTVDVYSKIYSAISGANRGAFLVADGANATTRLLLGVPALYFGAWQQAFASTHNVTASNSFAYVTAAHTLSSANSTAYQLYSSHLLALFNSSWASSWGQPSMNNLSISARASVATQSAGAQYVSTYMPETKSFGLAVVGYFTLADLSPDSHSVPASELERFAVSYITNTTSFSALFVNSTLSLGRIYDNSSLYALAGNVVWSPAHFGLDPGLSTLVSFFVSPARDTTLVSLGFDRSSNANLLAVRSIAGEVAGRAETGADRSLLVTGQDAINNDFGNSTQADLALILPVTLALLIVATGLFFRSVLTPFITLATIGVALGISQVFIIIVADLVAKVDFTIPTVLLTILIGVGTDYSVFVIARYREERVRGLSVQDAVETSVTWAGESIATSGATVIISFLALALTSIVFLKTMGFVVGLGVLVALFVALTLVPAVVGVIGGRTFWPNSGDRFIRHSASVMAKLERKSGYFSRSGTFAVKRAKALIILAILVSVPASYVYATTTPTYDFLSAAPGNLESVSASNHLTDSFGGGRLFPTYVVLTFSAPIVNGHTFDPSEMGAVDSASSYLAGNPDVKNVTGPTRPFGTNIAYDALNFSAGPNARTYSGMLQSIGRDNRTALITVNFGIDPYSTKAIEDAQSIRQHLHSEYSAGSHQFGLTGVYVGGASGSILDTKNVFDSQFSSVVPLVAVGVALVLLVVLGSLFLPVFAVFSVLMSIVWTLAATKLVFQTYYNYQILFITPFFLFVTLLGLGMDYNVFILTRVREEATKGGRLDDAIVRAIEQTGGIITAAAIILAGSLGALMLSSDLLLKQLGFSFAFSILIDALIVRTYLVPAVMSKMGKWNWYSPIPYLNRSHTLFEKADREPA